MTSIVPPPPQSQLLRPRPQSLFIFILPSSQLHPPYLPIPILCGTLFSSSSLPLPTLSLYDVHLTLSTQTVHIPLSQKILLPFLPFFCLSFPYLPSSFFSEISITRSNHTHPFLPSLSSFCFYLSNSLPFSHEFLPLLTRLSAPSHSPALARAPGFTHSLPFPHQP